MPRVIVSAVAPVVVAPPGTGTWPALVGVVPAGPLPEARAEETLGLAADLAGAAALVAPEEVRGVTVAVAGPTGRPLPGVARRAPVPPCAVDPDGAAGVPGSEPEAVTVLVPVSTGG